MTAGLTDDMLADRTMCQEKLFKECRKLAAMPCFKLPMLGLIERGQNSCMEMMPNHSMNADVPQKLVPQGASEASTTPCFPYLS